MSNITDIGLFEFGEDDSSDLKIDSRPPKDPKDGKPSLMYHRKEWRTGKMYLVFLDEKEKDPPALVSKDLYPDLSPLAFKCALLQGFVSNAGFGLLYVKDDHRKAHTTLAEAIKGVSDPSWGNLVFDLEKHAWKWVASSGKQPDPSWSYKDRTEMLTAAFGNRVLTSLDDPRVVTLLERIRKMREAG